MTTHGRCLLAHRRLLALFILGAAVMTVALSGWAPTKAAATQTSFKPIERTDRAVKFNVNRVADKQIRQAWIRLRRNGDRSRREVGTRRVRRAARRGVELRVRSMKQGREGKLVAVQPPTEPSTEPPPTEPPPPEPTACDPNPATFTADGCDLVFDDPGTDPDASAWRGIECGFVDAPILARHEQFATGGHVLPGGDPSETAYRRLTVFDGDDFYGERCELGVNEHRVDSDPNPVVYREGQRWITEISLRLGDNYPLASSKWQTVMQMKQAQPSAGGGGAPALELQAKAGRWYVIAAWNDMWSAPAVTGEWTRFAFDIRYSRRSSEGTVNVYVDLNGDGDTVDAGEQSPTLHTATLKTEVEGGWSGDGIAPGTSIPSHLRTGVYHDPTLACVQGCSLDVDNVQAFRVG